MEIRDIAIFKDDIVLDDAGIPILKEDVAVLEQDIKHSLLASGFFESLIGENSDFEILGILQKLELRGEADGRVEPGTVSVVIDQETGVVRIKANTSVGKIDAAFEVEQ